MSKSRTSGERWQVSFLWFFIFYFYLGRRCLGFAHCPESDSMVGQLGTPVQWVDKAFFFLGSASDGYGLN